MTDETVKPERCAYFEGHHHTYDEPQASEASPGSAGRVMRLVVGNHNLELLTEVMKKLAENGIVVPLMEAVADEHDLGRDVSGLGRQILSIDIAQRFESVTNAKAVDQRWSYQGRNQAPSSPRRHQR